METMNIVFKHEWDKENTNKNKQEQSYQMTL